MKQVVQNLRSGVLELLEVPCPKAAPGSLLIQSRASLISAGTERMLVEFGQASLVAKARQNPDRVKQVLDKIRADGLLPTLEAVFARLDEPLPLGYSNAGVVVEVGAGVEGFAPGDRVANNGAHAEMVCRPVNLCARIPDGVADDEASFAVLASIGLQGVRLLAPQLGETVAVFGLGLIGLVSVQLLVAAGVRVLGVDLDPGRLELARKFGATPVPDGADPVAAALSFSGGQGVDGVLITASAKNDSIVSQSARMTRKRGRIVLVGVVDLQLDRAEFYEKELSFQVSCSYGPGRYDAVYEEQGRDYPFPFVRWTEQRNIAAVLDLCANGRLDLASLITARVPHAEAERAYELVKLDRSQLGVVLTYPEIAAPTSRVVRSSSAMAASNAAGDVRVGLIGAGAFATRVLLPELKKSGARLVSVASAGGVHGAHAARKFGFAASTTDYRTILDDDAINTVFVATRHNTHARMAAEALDAGKHVFVEKPLAIDGAGLRLVQQALERNPGRQLMVGFNRRFSPHAQRMRTFMAARSGPACLVMTVNAGKLPADHWQHDLSVGGGRLIGEGCHWIDLLSYLAGAPVVLVEGRATGVRASAGGPNDCVSITLQFADGSIGTLHYFANGHSSYPKERLQAFFDGQTLELDNFRRLRGYGMASFRKLDLWRQDKGHAAEIRQFVERVGAGGAPLITPAELWNATQASFAAQACAAGAGPVAIVD